nr:K818 [uncultured bacterium]
MVAVSEQGELLAVGNGEAQIAVIVDGVSATVPVTVTGWSEKPEVGFRDFISPIISRAGCNQGACHASQYGKGGFVLSVFGFDPSMDHAAIVRDRMQRRLNFVDPEASLIVKKPTMQVSHGGGQRLKKGSVDYDTLITWIRNGAPAPRADAPTVTGLSVFPRQRRCTMDETQQLRVEATYSDGTSRDVTGWARFDSMDEGVVSVSENGQVHVVGQGQAAVMVRFDGEAQIATFMVPYGPPGKLPGWENNNFVDELASDKFRQLGIEPSPLCDEATFIRRAFLDAIGTLPTPEQTRAFLDSTDPNKRTLLVDRLLGLTGNGELDTYNDQYAAYWTLKWSDLLRNTSNGNATDEQRMWAMHNWIKESFRTNKSFDKFVSEMVTAKGSVFSNGPASYYQINNRPDDLAESTAQLFLGVRLQCAKCHHHPFEKYSQDDYYSFAAFFSRVGTKSSQEFGLFGREQVVMVKSSGEVRNPRNGKTMPPQTLSGEKLDHPLDRRIPLANWLTSADNKDFARSIANRYVSYLLGRGLVEPVDDMRATNPASNPELLDRLAQHFTESGFNVKQLMRAIMISRLYQLDSQPLPGNAADAKFYSHYYVKRLSAEPLLDAVDRVTASPTKFRNLPAGTRAIELPDAEYPDYFLNVFGKPKRASVCECERSPNENLAQALHTLNGDVVTGKIAAKNGRVAELLATEKSDAEIIEDLYLAALCRPPTNSEVATMLDFREHTQDRKEFFEDLLWGLVNSKQFLFVH